MRLGLFSDGLLFVFGFEVEIGKPVENIFYIGDRFFRDGNFVPRWEFFAPLVHDDPRIYRTDYYFEVGKLRCRRFLLFLGLCNCYWAVFFL